jgi:hypothetical protein
MTSSPTISSVTKGHRLVGATEPRPVDAVNDEEDRDNGHKDRHNLS